MAWSRRSRRAAKVLRAAACSTAAGAEKLRELIAEHGAGARALGAHAAARPAAAVAAQSDGCRARTVAGAGQRSPLRWPRLQAPGADRPAHRRFRFIPAQMRDRSGAAGRNAGRRQGARAKRKTWLEQHEYRVVEVKSETVERGVAKVLDALRGVSPLEFFTCAPMPSRRKPRSLPTARYPKPRLAIAAARSPVAQ